MARDVARATLYRGAINLWVEDDLTRAYLRELWNEPSVAFFIGGGNEGVQAIVKDAERAGHPNVFALIDRDFRISNKAAWFKAEDEEFPRKFRTFFLPRHEIENYLLDAEALHASRYNNLGRTADQIEGYMRGRAEHLVWWAACREVVAEFRLRFRADFLSDPRSPPVDNEGEARRHICESDWFRKLADEASRSTADDVHRLLAEAHVRTSGRLEDGSWVTEFAGKEIFRHAASRIFDRVQAPPAPKGAEFDADLAKEIGAWQFARGTIPADLSDLLSALKARVATP